MTASHRNETGEGTIRALARVVRDVNTQSIPSAAMRQASLLLLDTIGCGIAGVREAVAQAVCDVVLHDGGTPECALIGRAARTTVLNAVLANGVAIRVLDLNDYLIGQSKGEPETAGHPSDNIPVALAVGAARGRSGADVLASIVIGYELYARLQETMDRNGAWDSVTASGPVAAAMAARLMDLPEEKFAHALALGAARAATPAIVRTGHISAAKSIANALVTQAGVQAALLAERGLTGPLPILDDARGLGDLFAGTERSALAAPMPSESAIARAHVKTYPCVNTAQSAVAAALGVHANTRGNMDNLVRLQIVMADYAVVRRHQEDKGRARPTSREAADHSFPFIVAVTLIDGAFGTAQFENERWRDPRVMALMEKIVMRRDAALNALAPGAFPCRIFADFTDREQIGIEVGYPPGFSRKSRARVLRSRAYGTMQPAALDPNHAIDKFHAITAPHLSDGARARIVDAAMEFHHSRSTATLDAAIAIEGTFR